MRKLKYFLREAFIGIRRHIPTTVGTVLTMFLSLLLIGSFMIGGRIVDNVMGSIEDQISITLYLGDEADETQVAEMQEYIEGLEYVESVYLTTKEEALENFNELMGDDDVTSMLGEDENPLPASLDITLTDTQEVETVVAQIEEQAELLAAICDDPETPSNSISYGQETVDRLFSVTNMVRAVGYVLIALFVLIAVIFINNTVRLAIMNRRKEISIERLGGASNSFIRAPFLIESSLHACFSVLLSVGVLEIVRNVLLPKVSSALPWLPVNVGLKYFVMIYIVMFVVGLLIGLIGSALAMRKYLKV